MVMSKKIRGAHRGSFLLHARDRVECVREEVRGMCHGGNASVLDATGKRKMELNSALADVVIKRRRTDIEKQRIKCVGEFVKKIQLMDSGDGGSTKSVSVLEVVGNMESFLGHVQDFVDEISLIDSGNSGSTKSVSVKEVAEDMQAVLGLDDLALIEKVVMRKYEKTYGEVPKTDRFFVEHVVNVYTEKDRSLIEDAIMACI